MSVFLGALAQVLLVNLILSGDNAVVIGLAARELPPRQSRQAILLGGGFAVLLRLVLTIPAALLLGLPFLRAIGGLILLWVAFRLARGSGDAVETHAAPSLRMAVRLIVIADLTMSLDNILAVAAVADNSAHSVLVLVIGLVLSIPPVLLGGDLIARLMRRLPIVIWLGAGLLVYTAADLIANDTGVEQIVNLTNRQVIIFGVALAAAVLAVAWWQLRRLAATIGPEPLAANQEQSAGQQ